MLKNDWPLVCVTCRHPLDVRANVVHCVGCEASYVTSDDVPLLLSSHLARQKATQAAFFDKEIDEEFELERPAGSPSLYRWLLTEKFRQSVAELDLRSMNALVVCGGSGMDAEFLAQAGARVISSDISLGAARRARARAERHGVDLDVIVADVENLPFPDHSIDVVYVHDGLHHLERPLEGLAEMSRVARRAICVTEPARAAATAIAVRLGIALDHEESGNRVERLALDEIRATLGAQGFRVVIAKRYAMYYRHEPGPAVRLLSFPLLLGVAQLLFRVANVIGGPVGNKLAVQAIREAA